MAKTPGTFGGFAFDPEAFADYLSEKDNIKVEIIASGIYRDDPTINNMIGSKGNVGTIPFYLPLDVDASGMGPLNNDGKTNNTPSTITGSKQTCMLIQRMKAFKSNDFTKELTGADPMQHIANSINKYYQQVWQRELMNIADAVLGVSALSDHVIDLTGETDPTVNETSLIFAEQAAFGDAVTASGLYVMHSLIYAKYQALDLVQFRKFSGGDLRSEVELPTINGKPVLVTDKFTVTGAGSNAVYKTYMFGEGAFVGCKKTNYENDYYPDYDPETDAGVEKLYTKEGRVIHPNGLSLDISAIVEESPAYSELGTAANWSLKFDPKNVRIAVMKSKG